jgi:hypothetical protein
MSLTLIADGSTPPTIRIEGRGRAKASQSRPTYAYAPSSYTNQGDQSWKGDIVRTVGQTGSLGRWSPLLALQVHSI